MSSAERHDRAATEAALAVVDEALEAGAVTAPLASDRDLQELALAVRAESPVPRERFAELMELRVREGFPRERVGRVERAASRLASVPGRVRRVGARRPPMRVLAAAASVLVALVVAGSALRGGGSDEASVPSEAPSMPAPMVAPERRPADRVAGEANAGIDEFRPGPRGEFLDGGSLRPLAAPPGPGLAPGERNRRIERSASLTLAAPDDRIDDVASQIVAIVDRRRGFVLRSSVSTGNSGAAGGTFELRVPARDLQPTLRELSQLASVRSRTQQGEDVTKAFVSVEDRLVSAQAQRRGLLRRLERAPSDRAARAIRQRLELLLGEIRGLRGQLRDMRERTVYAAVTVSLVEGKDRRDSGGGGKSSTREALDDAVGSMLGAVNLALRVLGVLIPLALVGGLGWLAASMLRRRRREAALS